MQEGRERAQRERNEETIRSTIERMKASGHGCHCEIDPQMTLFEINRLGAGCKAPWYVCPVLDTVRRALGH